MPIEKIIETAKEIFNAPMFLETMNPDSPEIPERTGGYLCILSNDREHDNDTPLAHHPFGIIKKEKHDRYVKLSEEKARRVQNSNITILSSWETRNEAEDKKGGAIRVGEYILSFSGLPELGDEAFMLAVAAQCNLAPLTTLETIAHKSGSFELFQKLLLLRK